MPDLTSSKGGVIEKPLTPQTLQAVPVKAIETPPVDQKTGPVNEIKLLQVGGVYEIPIMLNDVLKINVILDSGATDVSVAPDVALTLMRTGTIEKADWMSGQTYEFADGSTSKSQRFKLKSISIGDKVFKGVTCNIAPTIQSPMLLGQSLLQRLGRYSIDYKKGVLQFE